MAGKYRYDDSIDDSLLKSKSGASVKKDPPVTSKNISASSTTLDKSNPKVTSKIDGSKLYLSDLPQNLQKEIADKVRKSSVLSPNEVNLLKGEIAKRDGYDLTDSDEAADLDEVTLQERQLIEQNRREKNIELELGVFLEKQDPNSDLIKTLVDKNVVTVLDRKDPSASLSQNLSALSNEGGSPPTTAASAVTTTGSVAEKQVPAVEKKDSFGSKFMKGGASLVKSKVGGILATGTRERAADFVSGLSRNQKIAVAAGGLAAGVGMDLYKKREAKKKSDAAEASRASAETQVSPVKATTSPTPVESKKETAATSPAVTSRAETSQTTVREKPASPAPEAKQIESTSAMQSMDDIRSSNSASPQQADKQIAGSSTTLDKSTGSSSSQKEISPDSGIFLEMSKTLNSINRNLSTPLSIRNTQPFRPSSNNF